MFLPFDLAVLELIDLESFDSWLASNFSCRPGGALRCGEDAERQRVQADQQPA